MSSSFFSNWDELFRKMGVIPSDRIWKDENMDGRASVTPGVKLLAGLGINDSGAQRFVDMRCGE
ncbi:hypothetical protein [Halomonas huangheensis]|uniref:Uncharacterized protein n=1 Tax=Halomonas huangheensis TaxID=1178482 RepID=W1N381_9GAMM|nr:hypothetical protein [Halomonas huangheensis]ALM52197.1 hypothetical protein AR456_07795 [Halomonas huangheensis]ERL49415.1 hypothetical protein BJB45_06445 [Halomonas huangheensis]